MAEELTDLQVEMLKALREHKKKSTSKIFSMDDFYESLSDEMDKSRFEEDIDILEDDDYVEKVAQAFNEIGGYDIRPRGVKYLRERMDPMDRLDDCKKKLKNFLKDLITIGNEGISSGDYELARERIVRWKVEAIWFLRQNVSDVEADRLAKKRPGVYVGIRRSKDSLIGTVKQYTTYLLALLEGIEKNPEMILRESAEDHAVQTAQPPLAEEKRVFVVHGHDEGAKHEVACFLSRKSGSIR